jgi:uroporphyrinogen-III synthase
MTATLIALRPEPGLAATLARASALGLTITGLALSEIHPVRWNCPDPASIDGLLIGSANAFVHGGAQLDRLKHKPVFAVGEATADAARAAGFAAALVGSGGLQGVLDMVPAPAHLLRIAGEEHVPLILPPAVSITPVIAYRAILLPLDPVAALLADGAGGVGALVLLHSAITARHFADECDRLGLARGGIMLAALGPRIAAAAGTGWSAVHTAARPDEAALLELAFDLCQNPRSNPVSPSEQP